MSKQNVRTEGPLSSSWEHSGCDGVISENGTCVLKGCEPKRERLQGGRVGDLDELVTYAEDGLWTRNDILRRR
jgi:hypothetical protein